MLCSKWSQETTVRVMLFPGIQTVVMPDFWESKDQTEIQVKKRAGEAKCPFPVC